MNGRLIIGLAWLFISSTSCLQGQEKLETIEVWLMPNERLKLNRPASEELRSAEELEAEIAEFESRWGASSSVSVLNVTSERLRNELPAQDRFFLQPFWAIVRQQVEVLQQLKRFSEEHHVRFRVRILDWSQSFDQISQALSDPTSSAPDIVQIGSTWREYFDKQKHILRPDSAVWNGLETSNVGTLKFSIDTRLLYYWKRMPRDGVNSIPITLDVTSWSALTESLDSHVKYQKQASRRPPLCLPIWKSANVIHDYAPFVWDGGGKLLTGTRLTLSDPRSLSTPLLIASAVRRMDENQIPYQLFAFPEASHPEARKLFSAGFYGGCIEPPNFLSDLLDQFRGAHPDLKFEDLLPSPPPPHVFLGGSDLMVTKRAHRSSTANKLCFEVASYLAAGPSYTSFLSSNGHLMPGVPSEDLATSLSKSVDAMLSELNLTEQFRSQFAQAVLTAVANGHSHEPSPHWPTVIESSESIESISQIWRRMADGAAQDRIALAAANADYLVNIQIDPWTIGMTLAGYALAIVIAVAVLMVVVIALITWRQNRRLNLMSNLVHSSAHATYSYLRTQLVNLCRRDKDEKSRERINTYAETVGDYYNNYTEYINEVFQLVADGKTAPSNDDSLFSRLEKAARLAERRYYVRYRNNHRISVQWCQGANFKLRQNGGALVLALEEWFCNSLSENIAWPSIVVVANFDGKRLTITTPLDVKKDAKKVAEGISKSILEESKAPMRVQKDGNGILILVRQLRNAYGVNVRVAPGKKNHTLDCLIECERIVKSL